MRLARTALALVASSLLLVPSAALAEGLPLGWGWSTSEDELTITIEAFDVIDDVDVRLRRHHDGRTFDFSLGDLGLGDRRDLDVPFPSRTSEYTLTVTGTFAEIDGELTDRFEIPVRAPMDFDVDEASFDEEARRFTLTMTQPAGHVELVVRSDTGELLAERTIRFEGEAPGTPLPITWSQAPGTILTIDVRAVSDTGAWASRTYIPWKVEFDAAHVNFESASWEIPEEDHPMLRERLAEITATAERVADWVDVELYIAGYTDTVGSHADNQRLSEQRARSIGEFFRDQGIDFDIYYQGFGEEVLEVTTEDDVDEPANRRSIFIMTTQQPPTSDTIPRSNWRRL